MKKLLLFLCLILLCGCASSEAKAKEAEIFMVNVGKADAIIVRVDSDFYLIDTATEEMWGRVHAALKDMNVQKLKGVFITHTDKDHTGGLEMLSASDIEVDAWYASEYFIDVKEEKHPAVKAAAKRGQKVQFLSAGDTVDDVFEVVGPTRRMEDKDDNNSLVMLLKTQNGTALFAGDMEYMQESTVLSSGKSLRADVLKVANHADDDTTSAPFISAVKPKYALISTSSYEKPETPDPNLVSRLENAGAKVFCTENSDAGIRVLMNGQGITADYAGWKNAKALPENVHIIEIDALNDTIVIENRADAPVPLDGFYLYSDKGKEMMFFDKNAYLPTGGKLTVGTTSTENTKIDILWNDKNVINDKKEDKITLFDPYGRAVASLTANE